MRLMKSILLPWSLTTRYIVPPNGQNYPGWKNEEVTRICHAVPEELDEGRRAQMLRRFAEIFVEEVPVIPLYYRSDYVGWKALVRNLKPTGADSPITWNVTQWAWSL